LISWGRRIISFVLFLAMPSLALAEPLPQTISVYSEAWTDATNKDGTGYYWDILRAVFEQEGSTLSINISTYKRSVGMVQTGKADLMVGAYVDEIPNALYPKKHFDADKIAAVYKKDLLSDWQGESSLQGKKVGWVKGYELEKYIPQNYSTHEHYERDHIFELLESGKLEIFLDAEADIRHEMKARNIDESKYAISPVKSLKLYFVFADNERGQLLQSAFDRRFEEMLKSGELKALNDKWKWDVYPFK
jgi:polar amino acid transport system substrate-binding protein